MMKSRAYTPIGLPFIASLLPLVARAQTAAETDPGGLARLHDIVVPDGVDLWWPPAIGWYVLAGLVVILAAWGLWRIRQRRRAVRYRVEALAELRALRRHKSDPRAAAADLLVLLKRTALAAYPREQVAGLSGEPWWGFLDLSGGRPDFANGLGDLAEQLVYAQQGGEAIPARDLRRLYQSAEHWIRRHRPADALPVLPGAGDGGPTAGKQKGGG